jgi:hypothetical protein
VSTFHVRSLNKLGRGAPEAATGTGVIFITGGNALTRGRLPAHSQVLEKVEVVLVATMPNR